MLPKARGKQGSYPIPLNKDWKARVDNAGGAQALILRTYRWQDHDHRYTDDTPENRHSATCLLVSTRTESLRWSYWFGANRGPNTRLSTRRGWWYCTVKETRLRQIDLRRLVNASQRGDAEWSEGMILWQYLLREWHLWEIRPRCTFLCQVYIIIALETIRWPPQRHGRKGALKPVNAWTEWSGQKASN